jgi:autotransporter-associated beta strand protein
MWPIPTRNNVFIGHNSNTTMSVNGAFFQLLSLTIESAATAARTYNDGGSGGISLTVGLYNQSTASQTFNVPIGVDATSVTFETANGNLNFSQNFFLNNNTAVFTGGNNTFISGHIQGTGGSVTKNGSGLLIFANNSNNYTGSTTINAGTLRIGNDGTTGVLPTAVTNNGTLEFRRSNDYTYSSVISGTGQVRKGSTGVLTLSASNTYSGTTTVDAGTLRITNANALGSTAAGTTVTNGAALELSGGLSVGNELLVLYGEGISTNGALRNISGNNSWSGQLSIGSNTRIFTEPSTTLTLSGAITSGASYTVTKTGTGTLTLGGSSANTANGTLAVTMGTLNLNKPADTRAVDNVTVSSGATLNANAANQWGTGTPGLLTNSGEFNLNNHNQKLALAGSGTINLGSATLTIENTLTDTYTGGINGTGSLVKTGAGDQTLSGALTYTGSTTISQGILDLQTNTIGSLTVESGGTLRLSSGQTLTVASLSTTGDSRISANANSSLVISSGSASIGTETIHNLVLQPGATLTVRQGKTLTINGTLELNGGTLVLEPGAVPAALAYGPSAELFYNGGVTLNPGNEWTASISPNTVRVGSGSTVNLSSSALAATSLIINGGGTFGLGSHSLELRSGGNLTNNGTFNAGTGTIVFNGGNTVGGSSATTLYNADIEGGGVNFGSSSLDNNLRILAGGFVNTNRPTYGSNATLIYETGGTYGINSSSREWQLGTTSNNPPNVEIRTSSVVVDATGGSGLRCNNLSLNNTGSMTFNPPTSGSPSAFDLILVGNDLSMTGTSSFTVNDGDGPDLKPTAVKTYDVRVLRDINIGSSATMTLNGDIGDDLYVRRHFTIDGTFAPGGRAVYFFSATDKQILTDNGGNVFNFVRVQNTSGLNPALEVVTDWTVANQLEVASGIVTTTTGNTLFLEPDAELTFVNLNNWYLNGRTEQTKDIDGSGPVEIAYGLTIDPNSNDLGLTTVLTISGPDGVVSNPLFAANEGIAKQWDIQPTTQPSTQVDLEFLWSSAHHNGKNTADLFCWRLPDGASEWRKMNSTAYGLFPVHPADSFSIFTFSDGANPLPVQVVSFEGQSAAGASILTWTTATEMNSAWFGIERSADGKHFEPIGQVEAAGTSTRRMDYRFTDEQPERGWNYYRLRQMDRDGSYEFSQVIALLHGQPQQGSVFPVPAINWVQSTWTLNHSGPVSLTLYDLQGRAWKRWTENAAEGEQTFGFSLSGLPSGAYLLELRSLQGERLGTASLLKD